MNGDLADQIFGWLVLAVMWGIYLAVMGGSLALLVLA